VARARHAWSVLFIVHGLTPTPGCYPIEDIVMNAFILKLGQSLLGGIGLVWLFLEAYYGLGPTDAHKLGFLPFLCIGLVVGGVWFGIDGFVVAGFLRRSVEITSNAIDATITIIFGDLFAQDGCKVVSVNDFFDSAVDDRHVASKSLHGLMLTRCWARSKANWDDQVERELAGIPPTEDVARPSPGKPKRYAIGTTASVVTGLLQSFKRHWKNRQFRV